MSISLQPVDIRLSGWTGTVHEQNEEENGINANAKAILGTPLESLTSGVIDGSGVFDKLMQTVKLHLKEEYDSQRITGDDYANVYISSVASVLQASTQFLLNEQQVHEINARIGLLRQQTVTELANTDDNIPAGFAFNFVPNESTQIPPSS